MNRIDPFTRTPGIAGAAFIDMHYADAIIENFESDLSSKYVYKIVGLRGAGKSVEYGKIINSFSKRTGWLVYTLSAAGDPVSTLISLMSREPFIDDKIHTTTVTAGGSASADIMFVKGGADVKVAHSLEGNSAYYAPEAALSSMIQKANDKGYKVLVGVDDISKTLEMVRFMSIWGTMLLDAGKHIYFVCTGLSKNIEEFASETNLSFFKRSDLIEIGSLNKYEISYMYRKLLEIDDEESVKLAKLTCGYAYAYQVLGSLYFNKKEGETVDDLLPEFEKILFSDSYDLIWKSLTPAEQDFVRCIVSTENGKTSEIKEKMESARSYDSLRDRLRNKHLINVEERGHIRIELPRFREYVMLWHS